MQTSKYVKLVGTLFIHIQVLLWQWNIY